MFITERPKNLHFDFIKEPTKMKEVTPILSRVREVIGSSLKDQETLTGKQKNNLHKL